MPNKHQIIKFGYYPNLITIDWTHMIRAFAIIRPGAGATILHQPGGPGTFGVGAAIDSRDIIEFSLQVDSSRGYLKNRITRLMLFHKPHH